MMILRIWAVLASLLLVLAIYLASATPPVVYQGIFDRELAQALALWGPRGDLILQRLQPLGGLPAAPPLFQPLRPSRATQATDALDGIMRRLSAEPPLQSLDALVLVVRMRCALMAPAVTPLLWFALALWWDAGWRRVWRSAQFRFLSSERYGLGVFCVAMLAAGMCYLVVLPVVLHPLLLPALLALAALLTGMGIANYHRRG